MAKARKAKKVKRSVKKIKNVRKRKSAAKKPPKRAKKSKRSPAITDRISEAVQVVADTMTDVARMRDEAKKRTPMDEG